MAMSWETSHQPAASPAELGAWLRLPEARVLLFSLDDDEAAAPPPIPSRKGSRGGRRRRVTRDDADDGMAPRSVVSPPHPRRQERPSGSPSGVPTAGYDASSYLAAMERSRRSQGQTAGAAGRKLDALRSATDRSRARLRDALAAGHREGRAAAKELPRLRRRASAPEAPVRAEGPARHRRRRASNASGHPYPRRSDDVIEEGAVRAELQRIMREEILEMGI